MEFKTPDKIEALRKQTEETRLTGVDRGRREDLPYEDKKGLEAVYTSTETKMMQHLDRMQDAQKGIWRPINLQISPTDKCNLECDFCSTWNRTGDTIPIDKLKRCIDDFIEVGPILSAEITGGGDPTRYEPLSELIEHLHNRGVDIGMITNGLLLHRVPQETLDRLTWLRISMSYLDADNFYGNHGSGKKTPLEAIKLPKVKGSMALSYVWTPNSDYTKLEHIQRVAEENGVKFVRIVPNCQSPEQQEKYREEITPLMEKFPNFFFQSKAYDIHFACRIGRLKPFLNSDGKIYQCSAAPLYTGKFSPEWEIGDMEDVKTIWPSNFKKMDTSNCYAGKCFYADQNRLLHGLEVDVPHENFI